MDKWAQPFCFLRADLYSLSNTIIRFTTSKDLMQHALCTFRSPFIGPGLWSACSCS